jgi:NADH-quinone oxidoreductase subunit N
MTPIICISALGIITLFTGVYNFRKALVPVITIGLLAILGLISMEWSGQISAFEIYKDMIHFDHFGMIFSGVMIISTLMIVLFSAHPYRHQVNNIGDIYGLLLFALVGGVIMTSFNNLSMLFLGIEILSIPLYILAGSRKFDLASNEASIKYFLMGSFSTGFLLFGIALIYGETHTFSMEGIRDWYATVGNYPPLFSLGVLMVLVAMLFKVSGVPFHFWAPDVYQGAPTVVTSFMSTVVKTAGFAALFRLLFTWFGGILPAELTNILWMVAALTITVGNVSALMQTRVKRLLAYSSISNAGYLLMAIVSLNLHSDGAILYYTLAYSLATILAFGVLILVEEYAGNDDFTAFHGLAKKNPLLAFVLCVSMISLAGIPPLAGFFGKYYIFRTALENNMFWLVIIAIGNSLIGVYYYFKVMISIFQPGNEALYQEPLRINMIANVVLILGVITLIAIGVMPDMVTEFLLPYTE